MLGRPCDVCGTRLGSKNMFSSVVMWSPTGAPAASRGNSAGNWAMNCWFCHFGTYLSTQL